MVLLLAKLPPPVAPPGAPRLVAGGEATFAFPVRCDRIDLVRITGVINFGPVPVGIDMLSAESRNDTGGVLCGRVMRPLGRRFRRTLRDKVLM